MDETVISLSFGFLLFWLITLPVKIFAVSGSKGEDFL